MSLCQKKTECRVANALLTAGATDLGTPGAAVMAPGGKHTNPERGRGVVRVAVESRLPKGERTSTAEVAHRITDDTGCATREDHHVVYTVVLPTPSKMDMVMNCRMLGWSRATSCGHRVVAPIDSSVNTWLSYTAYILSLRGGRDSYTTVLCNTDACRLMAIVGYWIDVLRILSCCSCVVLEVRTGLCRGRV